MNGTRILALSTAGIVALGLAACGGGDDNKTPAAGSSAAPVAVNIGAVGNMSTVALYTAIENGTFLKYGIRAKLQVFANGAAVSKALQAGTVQATSSANTTVTTTVAGGTDVVYFAPILGDATVPYDDRSVAIVASKASGITAADPKSFIGKKVGDFVGGTGDDYLKTYLTKHGVDPSKVKIINLALGNQQVALQKNEVDAISTAEPYGTQIVQQLGAQVTQISRGGGYVAYGVGLTATKSYVTAHADVVQKMAAAVAAADQWTLQNPDAAAKIATDFVTGLPASVASASIKTLDFDPRISGCTIQGFNTENKKLYDQKSVTQNVDAANDTDPTFMQKAEQQYPQLFTGLKPIPSSCPSL
jgi:ABC-type nitrate/sulfonate/bicarbonate transport system substrate-binding protein